MTESILQDLLNEAFVGELAGQTSAGQRVANVDRIRDRFNTLFPQVKEEIRQADKTRLLSVDHVPIIYFDEPFNPAPHIYISPLVLAIQTNSMLAVRQAMVMYLRVKLAKEGIFFGAASFEEYKGAAFGTLAEAFACFEGIITPEKMIKLVNLTITKSTLLPKALSETDFKAVWMQSVNFLVAAQGHEREFNSILKRFGQLSMPKYVENATEPEKVYVSVNRGNREILRDYLAGQMEYVPKPATKKTGKRPHGGREEPLNEEYETSSSSTSEDDEPREIDESGLTDVWIARIAQAVQEAEKEVRVRFEKGSATRREKRIAEIKKNLPRRPVNEEFYDNDEIDTLLAEGAYADWAKEELKRRIERRIDRVKRRMILIARKYTSSKEIVTAPEQKKIFAEVDSESDYEQSSVSSDDSALFEEQEMETFKKQIAEAEAKAEAAVNERKISEEAREKRLAKQKQQKQKKVVELELEPEIHKKVDKAFEKEVEAAKTVAREEAEKIFAQKAGMRRDTWNRVRALNKERKAARNGPKIELGPAERLELTRKLNSESAGLRRRLERALHETASYRAKISRDGKLAILEKIFQTQCELCELKFETKELLAKSDSELVSLAIEKFVPLYTEKMTKRASKRTDEKETLKIEEYASAIDADIAFMKPGSLSLETRRKIEICKRRQMQKIAEILDDTESDNEETETNIEFVQSDVGFVKTGIKYVQGKVEPIAYEWFLEVPRNVMRKQLPGTILQIYSSMLGEDKRRVIKETLKIVSGALKLGFDESEIWEVFRAKISSFAPFKRREKYYQDLFMIFIDMSNRLLRYMQAAGLSTKPEVVLDCPSAKEIYEMAIKCQEHRTHAIYEMMLLDKKIAEADPSSDAYQQLNVQRRVALAGKYALIGALELRREAVIRSLILYVSRNSNISDENDIDKPSREVLELFEAMLDVDENFVETVQQHMDKI